MASRFVPPNSIDEVDRFGRADLADYDLGRSRRPQLHLPTLELQCEAPRSAFATSFVYGLWHDLVRETGLDVGLSYVLKGCIVVGLEMNASEVSLVAFREDFVDGVYDPFVAKYRIFRARFLVFPARSASEAALLGGAAPDEVSFDLSQVRRRA